jgi:hypothetical protein
MDHYKTHPIDKAPWLGYQIKPNASFSIAYTKDAILLKFYVKKDELKITFHSPNDPVFKDSCVEFFISFDKGRSYYNFEWNAIGTCLIGFGLSNEKRTFLPVDQVRSIGVYSSIQSSSEGALTNIRSSSSNSAGLDWSLVCRIPLEIFIHHRIDSLSGVGARANFYKCGDECTTPHYLAWNDIQAPGPNYHQPDFFGHLSFA